MINKWEKIASPLLATGLLMPSAGCSTEPGLPESESKNVECSVLVVEALGGLAYSAYVIPISLYENVERVFIEWGDGTKTYHENEEIMDPQVHEYNQAGIFTIKASMTTVSPDGKIYYSVSPSTDCTTDVKAVL